MLHSTAQPNDRGRRTRVGPASRFRRFVNGHALIENLRNHPSRESPDRWILVIGVGAFALEMLVSARYGYHRDELYFLAAGRHPALGYVDQPFLAPFVARLESVVFANTLIGLRVVPALLLRWLVFVSSSSAALKRCTPLPCRRSTTTSPKRSLGRAKSRTSPPCLTNFRPPSAGMPSSSPATMARPVPSPGMVHNSDCRQDQCSAEQIPSGSGGRHRRTQPR